MNICIFLNICQIDNSECSGRAIIISFYTITKFYENPLYCVKMLPMTINQQQFSTLFDSLY